MRICTVIAGIVLCITGAFIFSFYANAFSGVAFPVALALLSAGILQLVSYALSGRKKRLPDTVLVEGIINFVFGFAVINDQLLDSQVTLFFGCWLTMCGANRISNSFAVSRINPKDWFKLMPLGVINALYGGIMLMPSIIGSHRALYVVGIAFILDGLSLMIYAMYMEKITLSQKAKEAKERARVKMAIAEEKRIKRNQLRKLSKEEKAYAKIEERKQRRNLINEKRKKWIADREAEREARRAPEELTVQLTQRQMDEIKGNIPAVQLEEDEIRAKAMEAAATGLPEVKDIPEAYLPNAAEENDSQKDTKSPARSFEDLWDNDDNQNSAAAPSARPTWNKPSNIPSLRKTEKAAEQEVEIDEVDLKVKRSVVDLESLESFVPEVKFESIELPELKLVSESREADRDAFLYELDRTSLGERDNMSDLKPLTLDELFSDNEYEIKPLDDIKSKETDLKLTSVFTFGWLNNNDV